MSGKARLRRAFVFVHRWIGIVAGTVLAIVGLTGALLAYGSAIMRLQFGDVLFPPAAPHASPDWRNAGTWIDAARQRDPNVDFEGVFAPGATPVPTTAVLVVGHAHGGDGAFEAHVVVPIDPETGAAGPPIEFESTWLGVILGLHIDLLSPRFGLDIIAWATLLALISTASGLYLWWPRNGRWMRALTIRVGVGGRREWLDWHNVLAVWAVPVLVTLLLTGLYLIKPQWVDPPLRVLSTLREPAPDDIKAVTRCTPTPTPTDALGVAMAAYPGLVPRALAIPEEADAAYFVALMPPAGDARAMHTEVWVDRWCPRIAFARDGRSLSAGEWLFSHRRPLHGDLMLGSLGSALVALCGVVLAALFVTGVVLWWRWGRAGRRSTAAQARPAAPLG